MKISYKIIANIAWALCRTASSNLSGNLVLQQKIQSCFKKITKLTA